MKEEKKVYIFLADGLEEIEALTVVDLLRRAGIKIAMVSITDDLMIKGSHGIEIKADSLFSEVDFSDAEMLVLPGGMPGTTNLGAFTPLLDLLKVHYNNERKLAAICAAPTVFSALGFLKDKKATCYPARAAELDCREVSEDSVVVDGNITTSRGLGTAIAFSLSIISQLISKEKADEIAESIIA